MVMSKWQSDSKRAETRQFLNLDSKSDFFVCKRSFKAWNAPKYWRVYQMDLTTAKYDVSAFTGKNNFWFLIKIEFCEKKWIWMKKWNFEQKNSFFIKFQKSTKNGQKKFNFWCDPGGITPKLKQKWSNNTMSLKHQSETEEVSSKFFWLGSKWALSQI